MATILIVDDNQQNRYMLQTLLQGYSHTVTAAANGAEALDLARKNPPDLIVSDILMPVMDGFTLCRRVKADSQLQSIPFVFYTATYTDPKDEELGLSLGAARYIIKPADPVGLMQILEKVLEEVQLPHQPADMPPLDETVYLQKYNEALIHKLEDKMTELEAANRALNQDIMQRKRVEETLRDRETSFRLLFASNPLPMWVYNVRSLEFMEANQAAIDHYGYSRSEFLRMRITEIRPPEDVPRLLEAIRTAQPPPPSFGEWRHRLKNGELIDVEITSHMLEYAGQQAALVVAKDITGQKQTREALRQSEERFRSTFEQAAVGIGHVKPDGRWLRVNQKLCDLVGYSREEMLQRTFQDITHPDDLDTDLEYVRQMLAGQIETYAMEKRYIRKNGTAIWILLTVSLVHTPGGEPDYFISVVQDISWRKKAEDDLRRAEQKYRTLVEQLPAITYTVKLGEKNYTTYISPQVEMVLGFSPEEWLADQELWIRQIHPDDRPRVLETVKRVNGSATPLNIEYRVLTKNGQTRWLHNQNQAIPEGTGPVRFIHGVMFDITERKEAEEEIRRRNRELGLLNRVIAASVNLQNRDEILSAACRELALAFDLPRAGVIMFNKDKTEGEVVAEHIAKGHISGMGRVIPVAHNPLAQQVISQKTLVVVPDAQNDPRTAPTQTLLKQYQIVSMLNLPLIVAGEVAGVLDLYAAQPQIFSDDEINLARRVSEQVSGALTRLHLAAERHRLEEQYHQAQKMEAVGQLTAGIAHDFNNLLTAINGYAELIKLEVAGNTRMSEMVAKVLYSGQRATDLVRQLLTFSRKQVIRPEVLDLNTAVTKLEGMLRRIIGEHIHMKSKLSAGPAWVKADPAQIEQIIVNLAVNGRDAMPEGGTLAIEIDNVVLDADYAAQHLEVYPGPYVLLSVSDTGTGMTAEVQAHLFEPFFTTKEVGKGTGLGLATVYGIVKQSGGHIWVYSEVGHGTTFKIYLPQIATGDLPHGQASAQAEMPTGTETILLVEDDQAVRELAFMVLQTQGYTVLKAENGRQALQVAGNYSNPIDMLVTDVVMPGMTGLELAQQLCQVRPHLKLLFMSGYTDEAISSYGFSMEETPFLQKPFSPRTLAKQVRAVLDGTA